VSKPGHATSSASPGAAHIRASKGALTGAASCGSAYTLVTSEPDASGGLPSRCGGGIGAGVCAAPIVCDPPARSFND